MGKNKVILCDTDVLIELFRQHEKTVVEMERIGYGNVEVSAVTVMVSRVMTRSLLLLLSYTQ